MANIMQDITEITKIVGCSEDFYKAQNNNTDPYYESTLYLVNNGTNINSQRDYVSSLDYPHEDLPDFSNYVGDNLSNINFIAYSSYDERFHLFVCNYPDDISADPKIIADETRLNVSTIPPETCLHYSYALGETDWTPGYEGLYSVFPSVASYVTERFPCVLVAYQDSQWRMMQLESNTIISTGTAYYELTYQKYLLDSTGTEWVANGPEITDRKYLNYIDCAHPYFSNLNIRGTTWIIYNTSNNKTTLYGIPLDKLSLPYSTANPFKIVWTSSNFREDFEGTTIEFCPDIEDSNTERLKYFARFFDERGVYLYNDIYLKDISYTDMYYGARKLSDTLVVDEFPGSIDYPNDKIYLQPTIDPYGYKLYFKHNNVVIPLATTDQLILVDEVENHPDLLRMTLTINGQQVIANVVCADEHGEIDPTSTFYTSIYNQLYAEFNSLLSRTLTWQPIT